MNEIPEAIREVMNSWADKVDEISALDQEVSRLDVRITEYAKTLQELRDAHRELGIRRTVAVRELDLLRFMAEQGCQRARIAVPSGPTELAAPAEGYEPPADRMERALAARGVADADPTLTRPDVDPEVDPDDPLGLGAPVAGPATETAGGDAPAEGGFHPEPTADRGGA